MEHSYDLEADYQRHMEVVVGIEVAVVDDCTDCRRDAVERVVEFADTLSVAVYNYHRRRLRRRHHRDHCHALGIRDIDSMRLHDYCRPDCQIHR